MASFALKFDKETSGQQLCSPDFRDSITTCKEIGNLPFKVQSRNGLISNTCLDATTVKIHIIDVYGALFHMASVSEGISVREDLR